MPRAYTTLAAAVAIALAGCSENPISGERELSQNQIPRVDGETIDILDVGAMELKWSRITEQANQVPGRIYKGDYRGGVVHDATEPRIAYLDQNLQWVVADLTQAGVNTHRVGTTETMASLCGSAIFSDYTDADESYLYRSTASGTDSCDTGGDNRLWQVGDTEGDSGVVAPGQVLGPFYSDAGAITGWLIGTQPGEDGTQTGEDGTPAGLYRASKDFSQTTEIQSVEEGAVVLAQHGNRFLVQIDNTDVHLYDASTETLSPVLHAVGAEQSDGATNAIATTGGFYYEYLEDLYWMPLDASAQPVAIGNGDYAAGSNFHVGGDHLWAVGDEQDKRVARSFAPGDTGRMGSISAFPVSDTGVFKGSSAYEVEEPEEDGGAMTTTLYLSDRDQRHSKQGQALGWLGNGTLIAGQEYQGGVAPERLIFLPESSEGVYTLKPNGSYGSRLGVAAEGPIEDGALHGCEVRSTCILADGNTDYLVLKEGGRSMETIAAPEDDETTEQDQESEETTEEEGDTVPESGENTEETQEETQ